MKQPQLASTAGNQRITILPLGCLYPSGPLEGLPPPHIDTRLSIQKPSCSDRSLARLQSVLKKQDIKPPDLLLSLGDQVYVDSTRGLFDPRSMTDRYGAPYRQRRARIDNWIATAFTQNHAAYAVPDDHEIDNNWEPAFPTAIGLNAYGQQTLAKPHLEALKNSGIEAFRLRHGGHPLHRDISVHLGSPPTWIDSVVFLANTRTERHYRNSGNRDTATIMSGQQFSDLGQWLTRVPNDRPRFLACPSMVLPRRVDVWQGDVAVNALRGDAWEGYPKSLFDLLASICEAELQNLVLLSNDEHLANVTRITIQSTSETEAPKVEVFSIHLPALYAPYPFANAKPHDFATADGHTDQFTFTSDVPGYRCTVDTWFPGASDGFVLINAPIDAQASPANPVEVTLSLTALTPDKVTQQPDWLAGATSWLKVKVV